MVRQGGILKQAGPLMLGRGGATVLGFALHEIVGGCFGGSWIVKLALQVAGTPFFSFGSVTVAVTV